MNFHKLTKIKESDPGCRGLLKGVSISRMQTLTVLCSTQVYASSASCPQECSKETLVSVMLEL